MHATDVLVVEILAIKRLALHGQHVRAAAECWGLDFGAIIVGAMVVSQAEVLGGDMALPLILGGEGGFAASIMEDTNERAGMQGLDVLFQSRLVLARRVTLSAAQNVSNGELP